MFNFKTILFISFWQFNFINSNILSKLWNASIKQTLFEQEIEDTGPIKCLLLLNDKITLASGSSNKKIKLWNLLTGQVIGSSLNEHTRGVTSLLLLNDNKIASASEDKTIKLWKY